MRFQRHGLLLTLLGLGYIAISVLAYYNVLLSNQPGDIFWFCYMSIFLIGIGMLGYNSSLIKSQLYIIMIPNLVWVLDFISYFVLGHTLFGIVDYFFIPGKILEKIISLQHIFTVPLALFVLFHLKKSPRKIWLVSCFQIAFIFIISRFLSGGENVNCVYHFCGRAAIPMYELSWFIAFFVMIALADIIFSGLSKAFQRPI